MTIRDAALRRLPAQCSVELHSELRLSWSIIRYGEFETANPPMIDNRNAKNRVAVYQLVCYLFLNIPEISQSEICHGKNENILEVEQ